MFDYSCGIWVHSLSEIRHWCRDVQETPVHFIPKMFSSVESESGLHAGHSRSFHKTLTSKPCLHGALGICVQMHWHAGTGFEPQVKVYLLVHSEGRTPKIDPKFFILHLRFTLSIYDFYPIWEQFTSTPQLNFHYFTANNLGGRRPTLLWLKPAAASFSERLLMRR